MINNITWGAIVARRLQNNSRKGDLFGGIYATRVANFLNIAPREGDMRRPPVYLDYEATVINFLGGMNNSSNVD